MKVILRLTPLAAALCLTPSVLHAQVVINEFQYDDTGTDDREYVELYNAGSTPVAIGGWVVGGYDPTTTNPSAAITAGTTLNPGAFYVLANTGVLNVNQVVAANFLENDNEIITLRDSAGVLVDAVAYETNKGVGFATTGTTAPADKTQVAAQLGPGIFGNSQGIDITGTPFNSTVSLGRIVDGRDTNNNGRDFALRPGTPGLPNNPGGILTAFSPADPDPLPPGASMPGMAGSFVPPRVIDTTLADTNNPNVIPSPGASPKAYICWDPSGGGNGATSLGSFPTTEASFSIRAYLDTTDLPVQFNGTNVQFRGSEVTIYSLGGGDALTNLTDLDGSIGLSAVALPGSESANGFTGVAWIYERVAADPAAPGVAYSEKLYLVDAKDGGDSDKDGNTPLYWNILAVYNLSATPSGWYDLVISIDAAGKGLASFNGQVTAFTTTGLHASAFNVGYRENLQIGTDGTPDALLRPPTFTFAPVSAFVAGDLAFAAPSAGARNMTVPALPGQNIGIFYSTDLTAGSWLDIGNATVTGITGSFADMNPVRLANPRGFYKAIIR